VTLLHPDHLGGSALFRQAVFRQALFRQALFRQAVFRQLHFATHAHDVPAFVKGENGTVLPLYPSGRQKPGRTRHMCIEDDTTHRRLVILQADQTVTGDSMEEYAHDAAIATCIRNFSSVVCTMYLHYCVANNSIISTVGDYCMQANNLLHHEDVVNSFTRRQPHVVYRRTELPVSIWWSVLFL